MFCLKYLTSVKGITTMPFYGHGTYWCMHAKDGDTSYSCLHTVSIFEFSAETELLSVSLSIWPAFPIVINYGKSKTLIGLTPDDKDNIVAALGHSDRVCFFQLIGRGSQLEKLTTVMQRPFSGLTHLIVSSVDGTAPYLSAKLLGGSAPCLQKIYSDGVTAFPIQHCQSFFYRPKTLSSSTFPIYPRPVIFHPRRWSPVWSHYPGSKISSLISKWLPPALIESTHLP